MAFEDGCLVIQLTSLPSDVTKKRADLDGHVLLGQGCNTLFVLLVILLCWVDKMAA
jgi:hypothetical protein